MTRRHTFIGACAKCGTWHRSIANARRPNVPRRERRQMRMDLRAATVLRRIESGDKPKDLAIEYGVHLCTIYDWKNRAKRIA